MQGNRTLLLVGFFAVMLMSISVFSFIPLAEATSAKVCGDQLCTAKMSIHEKIENYLTEIKSQPTDTSSEP